MFLERRAVGGYDNYRIPVLVRTEKGTLIGAYECRREFHDWSYSDIKIIRSKDEGKTWETLHILNDEGVTMGSVCMIAKGDVVHLLYGKNSCRMFYCKSVDEGTTFSEPREITDIFDKAGLERTVVVCSPVHGTVHNGNLLVPIWFAYEPNDLKSHWPSWCATVYSTDDGATWQMGEVVGKDLFVNGSEGVLATTADNKVLFSVRNENKLDGKYYRGFAISENGYSDWKNVELKMNMPAELCQGSMYSDGEWVYHLVPESLSRMDLRLKKSKDNFQTYETKLIDEIGGYSDFAVANGYAYILYERSMAYGIAFEKVKL